MEKSLFWEIYSRATGEEILLCLWHPKNYYLLDKIPPLLCVLSQMNSVHTLITYFFGIHFNIILPSTSNSPKWFRLFSFFFQVKFYTHFLSLQYVLRALYILYFGKYSLERMFETKVENRNTFCILYTNGGPSFKKSLTFDFGFI